MLSTIRKITLASLAATLLLPVTQVNGNNPNNTLLEKYAALGATGSAIALFALANCYLYTKHPVKDYKVRYDLKKAFNFGTILTKDYWKNVWYIIDDGIVGRQSKSKTLKADVKGSGAIAWGEDVEAHGLLGCAHEYKKPLIETGVLVGLVGAMYGVIQNPEIIQKKFFESFGDAKKADNKGNFFGCDINLDKLTIGSSIVGTRNKDGFSFTVAAPKSN